MTAQDILKLIQKNSGAISGLASSNDKIDKVIGLINASSSKSSSPLSGLLNLAGSFLGKSNLGGSDAANIIVSILSQLKGTNLSNFNVNNFAKLLGSGSNASQLKNVLTQIINIIK
ncbi:MAG: hypothetical protein MJZ28_09800 [Paludibacteraceae bacterium]|nr:hypothetical protein [Paludibacteraceae bacterium]